MNTTFKNRRCAIGAGAGTCLGLLMACQEPKHPPVMPYGQALDVTQANTFVEFDFRIEKPDRYDVVLEIFEKVPKEKGPLPELRNAHFKVHLDSLGDSGGVLAEKTVSQSKGEIREKALGRSRTEKTDLMSFRYYLVFEQPLNVGNYRIRVDNLAPIPALQGRLVKVSVERRHYPK